MAYDGLDVVGRRRVPVLLDDVSWDVFVRVDEVGGRGVWPPTRFADRDRRVGQLTELWRGGLLGARLGENRVVVNLFQAYSTKLANLLLMSEPAADGVDRQMLSDLAYDGLVDMTRYGGCLLLRSGDDLSAPHPGVWYPTRSDGDFLVTTYLSDVADSGVHDRVQTVHVDRAGRILRADYRWDGSGFGELLDVEDLPAGMLLVVPRDPRSGIWGTAKYVELFGPVVEIARRLSTNSRVLDIYTKPIPVFTDSEAAAERRYDVDEDDSEADRRKAILEGQLDMLVGETLFLDDTLLGMRFEQPSTQGVQMGLLQVDALMNVVRDLTGVPNLHGQVLSGEALKRLFVHFYAETRAMQNSLRLALERLLGVPVVWEHVFDTDQFATSQPMMPMPIQSAPSAGDGDEQEVAADVVEDEG